MSSARARGIEAGRQLVTEPVFSIDRLDALRCQINIVRQYRIYAAKFTIHNVNGISIVLAVLTQLTTECPYFTMVSLLRVCCVIYKHRFCKSFIKNK